MRSAELRTAGGVPGSVKKILYSKSIRGARLSFAITILMLAGTAIGQALYKYQDENGDWIYTDRPPADEQTVEVRDLPTGTKPPTASVTTRLVDRACLIRAAHHPLAWLVPEAVDLGAGALEPPDVETRRRSVGGDHDTEAVVEGEVTEQCPNCGYSQTIAATEECDCPECGLEAGLTSPLVQFGLA